MFSSTTASVTEPTFRPLPADGGRGADLFASAFLRLGITTSASFRGLLERLTMKTSHWKTPPTRTSRGPENVIARPKSPEDPDL